MNKSNQLSPEDIARAIELAPDPLKQYIQYLESQIERFSEIGLALTKEKNMDCLLEMILLEAKRITNADGGTLYMMTDDHRLKFEIMMTDSLNYHMGGTTGNDIPFYPVRLYDEDGKPNTTMIAAYVGLTGETVNIDDAYEAEGFDFSGTKMFDEKTGYRSKSFLTVPLKNHQDEIIGVLQLLNATDPVTGETISFSERVQVLVEGLAGQAAVVITNKNLIKDLETLFESFIKLIASAIDAKSPYTGGHCERVPEITLMLAEAVNKTKEGPLADVHFTENQMYELKIAAWLHDCGKVTTPEYVVDKSTKLETIYDKIHTVETRFEVLIRDVEIRRQKALMKLYKNQTLSDKNRNREIRKVNAHYRDLTRQIRSDLAFLQEANIGGEFMSQDKKDRVSRIARQYQWKLNGKRIPVLDEEEVYNLHIARGTLTHEERKVINSHITQTIRMLNQLPYPKHLRNVPEYAGGHHEKLDGTGYPQGLTRDEMSVQARIMAIADIFEALTARDRPYKKGKTLSQALKILGFMRNDAHIDPDLMDIFIKEKIYLDYAKKHMNASQVDEVAI
ncbi:MAG: HD domain-containing phosphohydrolase [Fidelibacterota bacterium]